MFSNTKQIRFFVFSINAKLIGKSLHWFCGADIRTRFTSFKISAMFMHSEAQVDRFSYCVYRISVLFVQLSLLMLLCALHSAMFIALNLIPHLLIVLNIVCGFADNFFAAIPSVKYIEMNQISCYFRT